MIEAAFELHAGTQARVVEALFRLPPHVRPARVLLEEGRSASVVVRSEALMAALEAGTSVLLEAPCGTFDIAARRGRIEIRCFLDVVPDAVKNLFTQLAALRPVFAFACAPSEREQRNLVRTQVDQSTIETWVGRDTQRYVPGLYWLTLLSADLANRHHVSLPTLSRLAVNHTELFEGQHLFQFYGHPDAWGGSKTIADAISREPGFFHIEAAKLDLRQADNFPSLQTLARKWP